MAVTQLLQHGLTVRPTLNEWKLVFGGENEPGEMHTDSPVHFKSNGILPFTQWDSPSPSHLKHQPKWANERRWKETYILSASDPLVIKLHIFAKILPTFQPHMPVQAKTWFPSNEMQKSPNLTNEPLCLHKSSLSLEFAIWHSEKVRSQPVCPVNAKRGQSKVNFILAMTSQGDKAGGWKVWI